MTLPTAATPQRRLPLASYRYSKNASNGAAISGLDESMARQVYMIKCQPRIVPVDINVQWLIEQSGGWNTDLDRLRYSPEQLYLRRFDPSPQGDYCVVIQMTGGNSTTSSTAMTAAAAQSPLITLYGNDQQTTDRYFNNLFLGNFQDVKLEEMGVISRQWVDNPHDVLYFSGTVNAAYGQWGKVLVEMQLGANFSRGLPALISPQPQTRHNHEDQPGFK